MFVLSHSKTEMESRRFAELSVNGKTKCERMTDQQTLSSSELKKVAPVSDQAKSAATHSIASEVSS